MKNTKKHILSSVLWVVSILMGYGQSATYVVRDLESWSEIGFKLKVNKKFSLDLSESLRLDHNSMAYNQLFTNLSGGYKFNKFVTVKTGFRFINEANDEDETKSNHLRYFLSGAVSHDISRFDMRCRLMYTNKNELGVLKSEGDTHINNLRLQVKTKYNIKNWKFDPSGGVEVFRKYKDGESEWNKVRIKIGTKYKTKSIGDFGAFYAIEKEFGYSLNPTNYILGLNYAYTFKLY